MLCCTHPYGTAQPSLAVPGHIHTASCCSQERRTQSPLPLQQHPEPDTLPPQKYSLCTLLFRTKGSDVAHSTWTLEGTELPPGKQDWVLCLRSTAQLSKEDKESKTR